MPWPVTLFQSEVEETLKRVQAHKGVTGVIIVNQEGKEEPCILTSLDRLSGMNCLFVGGLYLKCISICCGVSIGIPIRTTLDNATTNLYATQVQQLATKARTTVRDLDPTNELSFLRVRTTKFEIMIAPGK